MNTKAKIEQIIKLADEIYDDSDYAGIDLNEGCPINPLYLHETFNKIAEALRLSAEVQKEQEQKFERLDKKLQSYRSPGPE